MSRLRELFEEEINNLGAGIPEIREKVNHMELEYERVIGNLRDMKEKFYWDKQWMLEQISNLKNEEAQMERNVVDSWKMMENEMEKLKYN